MQINWVNCGENGCLLKQPNLPVPNADGVYVISHGGRHPRIIRVGKGNLAERIAAHRRDPQTLAFEQYGELYVTWAEVHPSLLDGVELYLARNLRTLYGERFPETDPIEVPLPHSAVGYQEMHVQ